MKIPSDLSVIKKTNEPKYLFSKAESFQHQIRESIPPSASQNNGNSTSKIFSSFLEQRAAHINKQDHVDNHSDHSDHHVDCK